MIDIARMKTNEVEYFGPFLSEVVKHYKPGFIYEPGCGPFTGECYTPYLKDNPSDFIYIGVDKLDFRLEKNKDAVKGDPRFIYMLGNAKEIHPINVDLIITRCFVCLEQGNSGNLDYILGLNFKVWAFHDTFVNESKLDKIREKCNVIELENTIQDTWYGLVEKKR